MRKQTKLNRDTLKLRPANWRVYLFIGRFVLDIAGGVQCILIYSPRFLLFAEILRVFALSLIDKLLVCGSFCN
jgi:hypothetical protein